MSSNLPLIVIVGPTASGKSDLALRVAQEFNGELICADSRTVYKGLDIGTAKPTLDERAKVPHHLLDVVEPCEPFTAAQFKHLANAAIADISGRGKLPVMVGGTGLYIDAVLFDYRFGQPADPAERRRLQEMSLDELHDFCRENDIEMPENSKNKRHLIRAIELGGVIKENRSQRPNTFVVGITMDRDILRERIRLRAKGMLEQGITDEVRRAGQQYGWDCEALTGNIYRVFRGVVEGTKSEEEALEEFVRSDTSLAKRQMTWFKRNPQIIWGSADNLFAQIRAFLHSS